MTDDEMAEWCLDNGYMMVVVYHDTLRYFTPISMFRSQGNLRLSAFDSTHADEEHPRTYKFEEMTFIGISRLRPARVELRKRSNGGDGAEKAG